MQGVVALKQATCRWGNGPVPREGAFYAPVRCMTEWHNRFKRSIECIEIAVSLARWPVRPNGMELAFKNCQNSSRSQVCQSASR
jgi:hypothetical protein